MAVKNKAAKSASNSLIQNQQLFSGRGVAQLVVRRLAVRQAPSSLLGSAPHGDTSIVEQRSDEVNGER